MDTLPDHKQYNHHQMPFVRIEIAVMTLMDGELRVLLGKRKIAPYAGKWALPGGVLRIDLDKSLEDAAQRTANERLGVSLPYLRQQCAVGGATRDPRAPWTMSVVYRALVPCGSFDPHAGKRLEAVGWFPADEAKVNARLAFDHAKLISDAVETTRSEIEELILPAGFLPERFTLGELQATCEAILGRQLDKSSFRRRIDSRQLVETVKGEMKKGAFRPAQIFRLA